MPGVHDLALFVVSGLLLNFTPGPDTLYIVGRSVGQGFRAGAVAALGIGAGCCVHTLAAAAGLSALLLASATAFTIVKLAGAAYLVYLGIALLRSGGRIEVPARPRAAIATVFMQGMLTNVLNPKVALFFLAFLPQFVAREAPHHFLALVFLGIVFNVNATLWNLFVAWLTSRAGAKVWHGARLAVSLRRVTGGLLVLMGVRLAFATRS